MNPVSVRIKTWFVDRYHLLFKSAAENHLRIQKCHENTDGSLQCDIQFGSYTDLKKYQRKLRRVTVSLSTAMALMVVAFVVAPYVLNPNRSSANSFTWNQSNWGTHASDPDNTLATATSNKTNWAQFQTKDSTVNVSSNAVTLAAAAGSVVQTDDTTTNTGFNLAGKSFSQTQVNGAGPDVSVGLAGSNVPINAWDTVLKPVPGAVSNGGSMIRNGSDDAAYVMQGNGTKNFYQYSVSGNTWTTLAAAPGNIAAESPMIRNGSDDTIYVIQGGNTTGFYKYSISVNSWTTLAAAPGAVSYGSNIIRNGSDNEIYVTQGNSSAGFYKYSISGNSWTTLTSVPSVIGYGGRMIRNGADDAIYVRLGSGATGFYK